VNLRRLAARNVWQNRGRYLAYLGSAAFSVMIYFLYTSLALHPDLTSGYLGAGFVARGMEAASIVLAVFTLLFMLYSSAAFLRSRTKEFGLLSLLGLTRRQLVWVILWENAAVAVTALTAGLALGVLFLRLFFMAVSALLQLPAPLPVYLGWPVWRQTLLVFGAMFLVVSLLSVRGVLRRSVIELIRAGRKPLEPPTFSKAKALLGVLLIATGYAWASMPRPQTVVAGVVPVTAMVSAGTYFAMREASVAVLQRLRRMSRLQERPGLFLLVGQLAHKLQENYRVLSAAAILIAVIISAMGSIFTVYVVSEEDVLASMPQPLQLNLAAGQSPAEHAAFVEQVLERHGVKGLQRLEVELLQASIEVTAATVVPYSLYAALPRPKGHVSPLASDDEGIFIPRFTSFRPEAPDDATAEARVSVGGAEYKLRLRVDPAGRFLNDAEDVLVVSDALFARWRQEHADAPRRTVLLWSGAGWRQPGMAAALAALRARYEGDAAVRLTSTYEAYRANISQFGLALFAGFFVSLVFFAATCSLLYFRLFTEIDEDRRYYARLGQLGLTLNELKGLAQAQTALLFAVPFLVGLVHSTFAMKALSTLVLRPVLAHGWAIAAGYLVLYGLFFALTFALYWRVLGLGEPGFEASWRSAGA